MILFIIFILYFLKVCSRRGEVVVLYLPCVRNGTYRRLECFSVRYYKVDHGSVRGFLNSSNAVTCGVVVLSICRFVDLSCVVCRVDKCCFGRCLLLCGVVANYVLPTTPTCTTVVLARRPFKSILLLHYLAQLVHFKCPACARVIVEEWHTLKGNHLHHSTRIRIVFLFLRSRGYFCSCYLFFFLFWRTVAERHCTITQTFRAHEYNCNAGN